MAKEIMMPKMGDEMTEGKLVNWLKHEGEMVNKGESLAEIETDKVTVEIEALDSGVLQRLLAQEGQMVPVGETIALLRIANEEPMASLPAAPLQTSDVKQEQEAKGIAVERGTSGTAKSRTAVATMIQADITREQSRLVKASPLARRIAQNYGLDLVTIRGTGPGGRIVRHDVESEVEKRDGVFPSASSPSPVLPQPGRVTAVETPPVQQTELTSAISADEHVLTRLQQTMARRMVESKTTAPHFYLTTDIDVTETLALRSQLNREMDEGEKISINDLVLKAVAKTLPFFPALNASFAGDRLLLHKEIAIAVAIAIKDGLVTPVVRHADEKAIGQIARETKGLAERARSGKSRMEDYATGTFTVSNLGMFGIDTFVAIINPPQAAILAVGAVRRIPVYIGDDLVPRERMSVTLSADHRVTDGATGAKFLGQFRSLLENPLRLLI